LKLLKFEYLVFLSSNFIHQLLHLLARKAPEWHGEKIVVVFASYFDFIIILLLIRTFGL